MKITRESQGQFRGALTAAIEFLNDDDRKMSNPCIYAEVGGDEIGFCFGPREHMQEGDVLWLMVEPDSFGDYDADADPEDEAIAIADNMWVDAVNDISAAMENDSRRI